MALIKCKECGKEISNKAKNCPNCGYSLEENRFFTKKKIFLILIIILLLVSMIVGILLKYNTTNNTKGEETIQIKEQEELNEQEKIIGQFVKTIKYSLNDTNSFTLNNIYLYKSNPELYVKDTTTLNNFVILLDFSGANKFGGIVRKYELLYYSPTYCDHERYDSLKEAKERHFYLKMGICKEEILTNTSKNKILEYAELETTKYLPFQ